MFNPRKDLLDVFPVDDCLTIYMATGDLFDSARSGQAEELSLLH